LYYLDYSFESLIHGIVAGIEAGAFSNMDPFWITTEDARMDIFLRNACSDQDMFYSTPRQHTYPFITGIDENGEILSIDNEANGLVPLWVSIKAWPFWDSGDPALEYKCKYIEDKVAMTAAKEYFCHTWHQRSGTGTENISRNDAPEHWTDSQNEFFSQAEVLQYWPEYVEDCI
tara:strand:- start:467 stop:988 length:522 start_codon:yes stop_codon:yes gene_type:complete